MGLVGYSAARIASPIFYAVGRSRVAVIVSTVAVAANLTLSLVLIRSMGFSGLALATSVAAIVNGSLAVLLLRRYVSNIDVRYLAVTSVKVVAASGAMALAVWWLEPLMERLVPGARLLPQALRLATLIGTGLVTLAVAAAALRVREVGTLTDVVRQQLERRQSR